MQGKILAKLEETPGDYVSVPELLLALRRADTLANRRVLRVQIHRLRKEGKTIEGARGSWSRGYRIKESGK